MRRGKLKMELVKKEKARLAALKMRKEGLVKKIEQLSTLCDVPACMIIHDPSTNFSFIWPDDFFQVRRLIDSFKANPTAVKPYGLSDFFKGRQKELAKTKYDDRLDLMNESQLRELDKAVRSRIDLLKREAMAKKENDVVLDLEEFEHIDQDDIFSAADAAMVKKENDVVLDLEEFEHIFSADDDVMAANDVFIDLDEIEEIDQDDIFSAADDVMVKKENNVFIDLDKIEGLDQDDIFSAADDVMAAMVKEENDVFIDLDEVEHIDQDAIFSAMSANTQLPVPDYYCPPPQNQPTPFMDHNYLNYVNWYADQNLNCSSMDVKQNVNWCADQDLNCSSMDVNWFTGDGGGVLASYLWH
ncbi:hypothetical protein SASPL_152763 [Salvia splendens]|uniref:MADS-box domain-containing protein n=1 Tax=Salvia splendens TaxID=180675 RepID=A0A8X8W4H8_SALSN|nr:hypothetical protein SASPL_152763 [Salvia splendens]